MWVTLSVPVTIPKENKERFCFWLMASGHSWTCCFGTAVRQNLLVELVVEAAHLPVARKQDERNRKGAGPKFASKLPPSDFLLSTPSFPPPPKIVPSTADQVGTSPSLGRTISRSKQTGRSSESQSHCVRAGWKCIATATAESGRQEGGRKRGVLSSLENVS